MIRPILGALLLLSFGGCKPAPEIEPPATPGAATPTETGTPTAPATPPKPAMRSSNPALRASPPPAELWKEFSGERAMQEVAKQVGFGPRPSGTPEVAEARKAIEESLRASGWVVEEQPFSDETPRGRIAFVNIIARHAGPDGRPPTATTPHAIVCSHYDTKRFSTIKFVGASDGASSTGALVELARVLALDTALATQLELVFFDGEEAVQQFTDTDGLYGSRHYAIALAEAARARQYKFAILWDMIGDKDLTITLPPDSPAELARGIFAAADALQLRRHFSYLNHGLTDDHVPLNQHGIPSIDLIDFDYPAWHTADDTLEQLSPESLQKVGAVTLHFLKTALGK
ncbi:MAG TPA: M28 family peptidase [Chthoniobacteraceae bacterium]|nr:M28 family peptidase [Chthoniobacteraceae bacterium]